MNILALYLTVAITAVRSELLQGRQSCGTYVVPGKPGGFTQRVFVSFSNSHTTDDVTAFLSSHGFAISDYTVTSGPVAHTFTPDNVAFGSGTLNLKVSAYHGSGSIGSAEISTTDTFKYASVRTVLKSSTTPGVVEGNFFYHNDNQETDFEILTTTALSSSNPNVPAGIWATNQALVPGQSSTHQTIPFTFNPTQDFHEYRIDWFSSSTTFFIDSVQKAQLTQNVPTATGPWIWNSWSNGDPNWSNGPPTADSITQIRSIEIYKGYTSTIVGAVCNI